MISTVIRLKHGWLYFLFSAVIISAAVLTVCFFNQKPQRSSVMGGAFHKMAFQVPAEKEVLNQDQMKFLDERFRRPSKQTPLENSYSFSDFEKENDTHPLITTVFQNPEDVVKAYFGILQSASNMAGYSGGCGSIGNGLQPYPYAYELFSASAQQRTRLQDFIDSFKGIGFITLLKLYPAYIPPGTPGNIRYYMFETEAITGRPGKDDAELLKNGSLFDYYYGLVTIINVPDIGWKIESIDCFSEDFLCAPEHSWFYLSDAVVTFIYHDWYQLIDQIDKTEQNGDIISIYASGKDKKYRFDFVRLTNGYDIMLHENIFINGKWEETNLLKPENQSFKLSVLNPNINTD